MKYATLILGEHEILFDMKEYMFFDKCMREKNFNFEIIDPDKKNIQTEYKVLFGYIIQKNMNLKKIQELCNQRKNTF